MDSQRWQLDVSVSPGMLVILNFLLAVLVGFLYWIQWRSFRLAGRKNQNARKKFFVLLGLRLLGVTALVWMLGGVFLMRSVEHLSPVWICIDRSASMLVEDEVDLQNSQISRYGASIAVVRQLAGKLNGKKSASLDDYNVKFFFIGEGLTAVSSEELMGLEQRPSVRGLAESFDSESRLGDAFKQLQSRSVVEQPRAVVLFSDGRITSGLPWNRVWNTSASSLSSGSNTIPVYSLIAGKVDDQPQLILSAPAAPAIIFSGDTVSLDVALMAIGIQGQSVSLSLIEVDSGSVVEQKQIVVQGAQESTQVSFEYLARDAGFKQLRVVAESVVSRPSRVSFGETLDTRVWEKADLDLRVRSEAMPVLLVSHTYSYELRFLRHWLDRVRQKGDATKPVFTTTNFVEVAERPLVQSDSSMVRYLPIDIDWWSQFEVCIFLDPSDGTIDASLSSSIGKAVEDEGVGVVYVAGNVNGARVFRNSFWNEFLPVRPTASLAESTEPVYWELEAAAGQGGLSNVQQRFFAQGKFEPPPTLWQLVGLETKGVGQAWAFGRVGIAGSEQRPGASRPLLLASKYAGSGRVVFQATDETYRWRNFLGADDLYHQYWSDMLAAVAKRQRSDRSVATFNLESQEWAQGENVPFEINLDTQMLGLKMPLESLRGQLLQGTHLVSEFEATRESNGRFRGFVSGLFPGEYQLVVTSAINSERIISRGGEFRVVASSDELKSVSPDVEGLEDFANQSGGRALPLRRWQDIVSQIPSSKTLHFQPLPPQSIWNHPLLVILVIALLGTEWLLRNRWGLI